MAAAPGRTEGREEGRGLRKPRPQIAIYGQSGGSEHEPDGAKVGGDSNHAHELPFMGKAAAPSTSLALKGGRGLIKPRPQIAIYRQSRASF